MNCPKCSAEMIQGFLRSSHGFSWSEEKLRRYFRFHPDEIRFLPNSFRKPVIIGHHCPSCRLILTEYNEENARIPKED